MGEVIRCRGSKICSPFVSKDPKSSTLYYVSAGTGEIYEYKPPDTHTSIVFSRGEPFGAQLDQNGRIHIADCAHGAVLRVDDSGQPGVMVKAYEERPFRGPNSIAFDENGVLYFTDSGPLGETTLEKPQGSIFCIAQSPSGGLTLRPLASKCLAHPWGIAVASNSQVLYIAEMMRNRIVRLSQRPSNIYHMSVFYQFAGGMGPSCVVCDDQETLYVGHYDFTGGSITHGKISVINAKGILQHTLEIPGTEITGICLSADQSYLIVTEASSNSIHRLPIVR